jgi:hypothetical protein
VGEAIARAVGKFAHALALLREGTVADCFYYPGMSEVPKGFDEFARGDAVLAGLAWEDLCPAYALALISNGSYRLPADDEEMETLWDELGGQSTLLWPDVRGVVMRSWEWLGLQSSQGG